MNMGKNKIGIFVDIKVIFMMTMILCLTVALNCYALERTAELENQIIAVNEEVSKSREANEKVLDMLIEVRENQEKQNKALELVAHKKKIERIKKENIILLKTNGLSKYDDLGNYSSISVEKMDEIIEYYDSIVSGGTPFKGKGYVFCQAAEETGLNPVYIFAHAAVESSYGNSYLARTKNNYFGINAVDINPGLAYNMGDSVDQGILNGAHWIKRNYYDNGYVTLDQMLKGGYATNQNWANEIESVIRNSIRVVNV